MHEKEVVRMWSHGLTARQMGHFPLDPTIIDYAPGSGPLFTDYYELTDGLGQLGKGSFGVCRAAKHISSKTPCALKIINKEIAGEEYVENFIEHDEYTFLLRMAIKEPHVNVVKQLDYLMGGTRIYNAMELLEGLDLADVMKHNGSTTVGFAQHILRQVLSALNHIHHVADRGLIHRDVKLANLRCRSKDPESDLVLVDFGLSCPAQPDEERGVCGTPGYMAPEMFSGFYNTQVDVWSAGVLFYFVLSRKLPWKCGDWKCVSPGKCRGPRLPPPIESEVVIDALQVLEIASAPSAATLVLKGLLTCDPKHRLTAGAALDMPWFMEQQDAHVIIRKNASSSLTEGRQNEKPFLKRTTSMIDGSQVKRRSTSSALLPLLDGSLSLSIVADLEPVWQEPQIQALGKNPRRFRHRAASISTPGVSDVRGEPRYALAGILSIILGMLSLVPYNAMVQSDLGSPFFIAFASHLVFVAVNIRKLREIVLQRKIPLLFHAGFVLLNFLFTLLKSVAFIRLPASSCMLLMNLQMLIGMGMQWLVFGDVYSVSQLSGCALISFGALVGGLSGRDQLETNGGAQIWGEAFLGAAAMCGSSVALIALSMLVKVAFTRFGHAVEEQVVLQHVGTLPLFLLGGQWSQIASRLASWTLGNQRFLFSILIVNMVLAHGEHFLHVRFARRAPNLWFVQLIEALKKLISPVVTALLVPPPYPQREFWGGWLLVVVGVVQFFAASESPMEEGDKKWK